MKKVIIAALLILLILPGCNALKGINCRSRKSVPVVFVTKSGHFYTVDVPYCDTINLSGDQLPPATVKMQAVKQ